MYAVSITVRIDPARHQEAMDYLASTAVPRAKSSPGFVRGTWCGDDESGHAMILFDSREHADQMASQMKDHRAPDAPAELERLRVYEVRAEA